MKNIILNDKKCIAPSLTINKDVIKWIVAGTVKDYL